MAKFSQDERKKLARSGSAMPDGSFPIRNRSDLKNAINDYGRTPDSKKASVKAHIIKRAKALGLTSMIPEDWAKASSQVSLSAVGRLEDALEHRGEARLSQSDWALIIALTTADDIVTLARGKYNLASKPGKNNWIEKTSDWGLPTYIAKLAQGMMKRGMSKSRAIASAIHDCKVWAAGGKNVKPDTRAKAAKALAEWEALKAKNKARTAAKKASN